MSPGSIPGDPLSNIKTRRQQQVRAEQIRLLYANATAGVVVTVAVASILSGLEWRVDAHPAVIGWLAYTFAVALGRFFLAVRYWQSAANYTRDWWGKAFSVGAGLSGLGWAAAGFILYPAHDLTSQVFLAFVLGGMMLGAVSLLSARLESFLAFILPIGLTTAVRFLFDGDTVHLAMGLLAAIFTISISTTTWRIYLTVRTSLTLQFDNKELVENLLVAKKETEELNRKLEIRVAERTAELNDANVLLRTEIEQRKQAEEDLLRARKLESLGVLVGGIAHDFNNFLTIVLGNIGLATAELRRGNLVFDILERTEGACVRASSLASQLLTFGKGGAPVRRITSATPLIRDAVALSAAGANVNIHMSIADDLSLVDMDGAQIGHALQNILLNARQAMPAGGRIEVRAENAGPEDIPASLPGGKYIRIVVRDFGCGIPAEILPRVFDPYFTTKQTGTGLGLAAAYAIVNKHKGQITVQSTEGVETSFSIFLPASRQQSVPELAPKQSLERGSGRILVMDDEEAIRLIAGRMLQQIGYEVVGAKDGAEAIGHFTAAISSGARFDAVLLDLTIPGGMGGKEAAARLKEIDPSVPLIVSSGYSDDPVMAEYRKYGFVAVLSKPWTVAQLSQVFKAVLPPRSLDAKV